MMCPLCNQEVGEYCKECKVFIMVDKEEKTSVARNATETK